MELIPEKLWALIAAVVSSLGGFMLYDRRRVDGRLNRIEFDLAQHKTDLAVVKESLMNLKEDTQEIKEFQKATVDILTAMNIKRKPYR